MGEITLHVKQIVNILHEGDNKNDDDDDDKPDNILCDNKKGTCM